MTLLKSVLDPEKGVIGLTQEDEDKIKAFIQNAVYVHCNIKPDEWFAGRDLMGGENSEDWLNTPLRVIYEHHANNGDNDYAFKETGKAFGRYLKIVLQNDKREFESRDGGLVKNYKWKR